MLVSISGLPGSGTSTVAHLVAEALGIERLDGGSVFRSMAAERGLTLAAFSAIAERDPDIDRQLDARLAARAADGSVLLESRLAGWILAGGLPGGVRLAGTSVWLACDPVERAARVSGRDGLALAAAVADNEAREASERLRYVEYYGIDLTDLSIYDRVLDSTETPPDALVATIVALVRGSANPTG